MIMNCLFTYVIFKCGIKSCAYIPKKFQYCCSKIKLLMAECKYFKIESLLTEKIGRLLVTHIAET